MAAMYKVLYITQFENIGGGETILLALLSKLDRKKFEPVVLVPQKGQLSKQLKRLQVKTYYLKLPPYLLRTFFVPGMSIWACIEFFKLVRKINPSIIHLNHLTFAFYGGLVGKILKIPVVATAHGPWDSYYFYQDLIYNLFVDKILANTPQVAKSLTERRVLTFKKVEVLYFGIDTNKFKPGSKRLARKSLNLPQNKLILTVVGRIDPIKDHLTFLKAASIIQRKYPNICLYIVGSKLGDFSKINDSATTQIALDKFIARNSHLLKKIIFAGYIDFDLMPKVYQATDIVVSSSLSESFGLTLAEASSCGLPVIATNFGNQKAIVKNNQTGFLVPPKREDLLAKKILLLVNDKKKSIGFGYYGRKQMIKNFSLKTYAQSVTNIYLSMISLKK